MSTAFRSGSIIILCTILSALLLKVFFIEAIMIPSRSMENTLLIGDCVLVNKLVHGEEANGNGSVQAEFSPVHLPSLKQISRGDVIVFTFPAIEPSSVTMEPVYFVKRCVARGGDELRISGGALYVNGESVSNDNSLGSSTSDDEVQKWLGNNSRIVIPKRGDILSLNSQNYSIWSSLIHNEGHRIEYTSARGIIIDDTPVTQYVVQKNYLFVLGDNREHSYDSRSWGFLSEEHVIGKAMMVYWSINPSSSGHGFSEFFSGIRWDRIGRFIQ